MIQTTQFKKAMSPVIATVLLILITVASCLILYHFIEPLIPKPQPEINISDVYIPGQDILDFEATNFTFSNDSVLSYRNMVIQCQPFGEDIVVDDMQMYWIWSYSNCAIIETNPSYYNKSLYKYHLCYVINNTKIGDCRNV